ncbi:antimicrobial peptide NK-lysin-like isoform X1 [Hemibagrus wyckioides]|uniref:antimicrobial peptide NK-lysin-like isoform X1 n=1 Tax=Hemibagrus wyckioides TaxID=337641 RepID=UPI00266B5DD4|nr:antimicrobial peptide NK-lysin-like isoform X1 [Hemibagrus wyckioides]
MLRNILLVFFFIGSACAFYLEYLKVHSEELADGTLQVSATSPDSFDQDEDFPASEEQIPGACALCKLVVKKVKKHLGDHENANKIKQKLMRGCNMLPAGKDLCKRLVDKHINILVEELSTDDDPKTVCVKAGICKSPSMLNLIQVFSPNSQIL